MTEFPYKARLTCDSDPTVNVTVLCEDGNFAFVRYANTVCGAVATFRLTPIPTPESIAKGAAERFESHTVQRDGTGTLYDREFLAALILDAHNEIARLT